MASLHFVSWFFGGAFLANAVPHFVFGIAGRPFQSPFATPRGEGLSSSTVNVLWSLFNLVVGYALVLHVGDFNLRDTADAAALGLGIMALSVPLARRFGRVNGGNLPQRQ